MLGFHWTKQHVSRAGRGLRGRRSTPRPRAAVSAGSSRWPGSTTWRGAGLREVLLYVESDNAPARKVYERLGFTHAASDTHVQFTRA